MKRNLATKIEQLLTQFPIVAIIGARQVGKTTLVKQLHPQWRYVDLQKPSDKELVLFDPELFFKQNPHSVILDEVQSCPILLDVLRGVIDEDRAQKGRFIITGSSSPDLLKYASESLAGRIAIVELNTLKTNEIAEAPLSDFYQLISSKYTTENVQQAFKIKTKPLSHQFVELSWLFGGYPEIALTTKVEAKQNWFEFYEKTYLYRDIASLFVGIKQENFQRFVRFLSHLSGTIINKAQLARDIEMSESTVRSYLTISEGTFLWRGIKSFERTGYKRLIKMPKGYLADSGLLHYLINIHSMKDLQINPIIGRSFEGFVINEIIKGLQILSIGSWDAYHYRSKHGAEIDLILEGKFGLIPIEIKYGIKVERRQLTTLSHFIEAEQLPYGIIINQADDIVWLTPRIIQIPIGYI